jgi:site-specific DNA recombinase
MRARHSTSRPHQARRPRHLLSGLLRCGVCGGAYTMRSSDRLGCVAHREKGKCNNNHTVLLKELQSRVLGGLKERMLAPEVFAEFVSEYRQGLKHSQTDQVEKRESIARQLTVVTSRIVRVVDAIADGTASAALKAKLAELETEKARLEAEQQAIKDLVRAPEIHPNLPELYKSRVADMEGALSKSELERAAAGDILRSLIEGIAVYPGAHRGETVIAVQGSIPAILDFADLRQGERSANRSVTMVVQNHTLPNIAVLV